MAWRTSTSWSSSQESSTSAGFTPTMPMDQITMPSQRSCCRLGSGSAGYSLVLGCPVEFIPVRSAWPLSFLNEFDLSELAPLPAVDHRCPIPTVGSSRCSFSATSKDLNRWRCESQSPSLCRAQQQRRSFPGAQASKPRPMASLAPCRSVTAAATGRDEVGSAVVFLGDRTRAAGSLTARCRVDRCRRRSSQLPPGRAGSCTLPIACWPATTAGC